MRFAKKNMINSFMGLKILSQFTNGINLPSGDQNVEIFNGPTNTIGSTVRKKLLFLAGFIKRKGGQFTGSLVYFKS